jgi:hypothetical protein
LGGESGFSAGSALGLLDDGGMGVLEEWTGGFDEVVVCKFGDADSGVWCVMLGVDGALG